MNLKLIKLLGVVSAGLCFIIICEWLYATYAQKQLWASVQAVDKKKKSIVKLPSIELTKRPESSYIDLVTRPLFIQGRRPVPEVASTDTKTVAVSSQNFNWALNGVYTYKDGLYALISRTVTKTPKDNFRKVTKNSDIDGWKLTEIFKDKVVVSQGDQKKELPLRKPKPKVPVNTAENPMAPQPIPGQPPQPSVPGQQPPIPIPEPFPVPEPEQVPEPEPVLEPELIPDENSETYFENNENAQFQ